MALYTWTKYGTINLHNKLRIMNDHYSPYVHICQS